MPSQSHLVAAIAVLIAVGGALDGQVKGLAPAGSRVGMIGPNDVISVYVKAVEDLSKYWTVDPSGQLTLPLAGTLPAAGKTVSEFEQDLITRLKKFIIDPQVTVSIIDVRSRPVIVLGAVGTPGILQLQGRATLLNVLMEAGGPKDAGPTVSITRRLDQGPIPLPGAHPEGDGQYSVATVRLNEIMAPGTPAANFIVQPQDVISVPPQPQPPPRLVHIIGEVIKPGAVELVRQQSVSLMQVLAAAGGPTHIASPGKTIIMHVNVEGQRTELAQVDLKKVMTGKAKDIELVAGDIVVVPTNQAKSYLDTAARAAVSSSGLILTRF